MDIETLILVKKMPGTAVSESIAAAERAETAAESAEESARTLTIDDTLSQSGQAADAKKTGDEIIDLKGDISDVDEELSKTKTELESGTHPDFTAGTAEEVLLDIAKTDRVPYTFRKSEAVGKRAFDKIVGGTVVWNQLIPVSSHETETVNGITYTNNADGSWTVNGSSEQSERILYALFGTGQALNLVDGHRYYLAGSPSSQVRLGIYGLGLANVGGSIFTYVSNANKKIRLDSGAPGVYSFENAKIYPVCIDLTAMFGTEIADYIYSLEQANEGTGVAFFRKLFPNDYYEYNAGELMSVSGLSEHKTVGFNIWDEEWENGGLVYNKDASNFGEPIETSNQIRAKNFIPVFPLTEYYGDIGRSSAFIIFYDADKKAIPSYGNSGYQPIGNAYHNFTIPNNCYYIRFYCVSEYGTTYNHDICINLSDPAKNGTYEPYQSHSYPLDNSLTLRGIPKLDSNNQLYFDGDTYESDGKVTRRYGIVDLGELEWTGYDATLKRTYAPLSDVKISTLNIVANIKASNLLTPISVQAFDADTTVDNTISVNNSNAVLWCRLLTATSSQDYKSMLSGVYLLYEKATPTTETADPFHNPQAVDPSGTEEYISTSIVPVGHETDYYHSVKTKLANAVYNLLSMIADTETTYTASKNYSVGDYLIVDSTLYKVTSAITSGSTITPNTNVTATTIMAELLERTV